ncbi:hypothetical protein BGX21_007107 [Mortierella sp. AD011]|nr:hypothetical protein BGX20_006492 [Mortierella sp. AD010]KAF9403096.1 hypothetical protein BGX21_007107 [Mortierella sp. AD011]
MTAAEHLQGLLSRPQEQAPSFEDIVTTDFSQTGNVLTNSTSQSQPSLPTNDDQQDGNGSQVSSNGTQDSSEWHASVTVEPESEKTLLQSLRAPAPEQQILEKFTRIGSYSYHTILILHLTPANSNNFNKNDSSHLSSSNRNSSNWNNNSNQNNNSNRSSSKVGLDLSW